MKLKICPCQALKKKKKKLKICLHKDYLNFKQEAFIEEEERSLSNTGKIKKVNQ